MSRELFLIVLFFFKQKTAYEMRISDWSSDVCSSELSAGIEFCPIAILAQAVSSTLTALSGSCRTDRKSVAYGKSVSVRVDLGGRRIIKKKMSCHCVLYSLHTTNMLILLAIRVYASFHRSFTILNNILFYLSFF